MFNPILSSQAFLFLLLTGFALWGSAQSTSLHTQTEIELGTGNAITLHKYDAGHKPLLLWLPSELGLRSGEDKIAEQLARSGITVWRADLLEANFLPPLASSIEQVSEQDVVALINIARKQHHKLMLMSSAKGTALAVRGARAWQLKHAGQTGIHGLILLHPDLYQPPGAPGQEAEHLTISAQTNLPTFILQPQQSPWALRVPGLVQVLQSGGATVYSQYLPNVRDRFYFRPDATDAETAAAAQLAIHIQRAYKLLATHTPPARASAHGAAGRTRTELVKKGLVPYGGPPAPPALRLRTLSAKTLDLSELVGQVVLVNFWASWCPPCVHEMPSMERLKQKLRNKPFSILAVNLAEPESEIRTFLNTKVNITFPVLLDPDQQATRAWRVFAYPTSYIVDRNGKIRYGAFGELAWDDSEVIRTIDSLLNSSDPKR